ncbi:SDR family oxidoreductase [Clostridium thermarum]|uniref:SDR family oxidoreductase n=1 Tax=Clostridium thermarum TaxID=1716543 RepID=UPI001123C4DE|nr:SDR family oxidoreductase [Clostridium thermarum]
MRILVTGGAGFIGSHIADELINRGHEVGIIDNMSHGREENINKEARFYKIDIRDRNIPEVFQEFKPEVLCHQAAQIKVPVSVKDPLLDADINIMGTINLLEACRSCGVKKVIYPASAAIFGNPQYLPIDEDHPLNMISGYGISKHTVEHYLKVYESLYGIKYTVLRYSNVYGPRQDSTGEGGVVAIFSEKFCEGQDVEIFGDGEQTRDFVYVADVAAANVMALWGLDNEIYNVCTGTKISVNDLFRLFKELTGKGVQAKYLSPRAGEIIHSYMTYEKIKKHIGWTPKVDIKEGLRRTLEYYQQ